MFVISSFVLSHFLCHSPQDTVHPQFGSSPDQALTLCLFSFFFPSDMAHFKEGSKRCQKDVSFLPHTKIGDAREKKKKKKRYWREAFRNVLLTVHEVIMTQFCLYKCLPGLAILPPLLLPPSVLTRSPLNSIPPTIYCWALRTSLAYQARIMMSITKACINSSFQWSGVCRGKKKKELAR